MEKIVQRAQQIAQKKKIENFDRKKYITSLWLLFLGADLAHTAALEVEEMLRSVGGYRLDDKHFIEALKRNSEKFIKEIDRTCTETFACDFGDLADEVHTLLASYIKNKSNALTPVKK